MEQHATEKSAARTNAENSKPAHTPIADSPSTDSEANEVKGGPLCYAQTVLALARVDGASSNHNETVSDDELDLDPLEDLLLSPAQEDNLKAGCLGCTWGPPVTNHNEMTVCDQDQDLPTDDLELTDEELDHIKGGPRPGSEDGGGGIGGDWIINHNELTVSDQEQELPTDDLELTDEELDRIKGGSRTGADDGGGGRSGGDWIINHNEMTLREE